MVRGRCSVPCNVGPAVITSAVSPPAFVFLPRLLQVRQAVVVGVGAVAVVAITFFLSIASPSLSLSLSVL